jgi:hypothetical protein
MSRPDLDVGPNLVHRMVDNLPIVVSTTDPA